MAFNAEILEKTARIFREQFGEEPLVVRSPGRVNIIGEHTDYNNGFVLPAAINKAIYVAVAAREDNTVQLYSAAFDKSFEIALDALQPVKEGWPNYILGVADQLQKRGHVIRGFNLVLYGDVPIGSGMSSSAAVECAVGFALNEIFSLGIDRLELALIAQKAEQEFAGVMVGVMDQFASLFGKKDHVIKLDCRSMDYEYVPFSMEGISILLLNTNVSHSLGDSEYNTRRAQCHQGVEWIREAYPQVQSLRDATIEMAREQVLPKDKLIFDRCSYVIAENERLLKGCEDLKQGDLTALGRKMYQTHDGLSRLYEVSCPELDFLVDAVRKDGDVLGARMMGGGFGGCTINIVKEAAVERLVTSLGEAYRLTMHRELTAYVASIEDGTTLVSHPAMENL